MIALPQALEGPAFDREVALHAEALELVEVPQRVVARDVVAAQERVVGGEAKAERRTPVATVLEAAVTEDIAAELLVRNTCPCGVGEVELRRIGADTAETQGTGRGLVPVFDRKRRIDLCVDDRRDGEVVMVGKAQKIRQLDRDAERAVDVDGRDEDARRIAARPVRVRQARRVEDRDAEEFEARILVVDTFAIGIMAHAQRLHLPKWLLGAAVHADDVAR